MTTGNPPQPRVDRDRTDRDWHVLFDDKLTAFETRLNVRIVSLEARLAALETKDAVADVHRVNVEKRLGGIEETLRWLTRLMIAALIMAVMAFVAGGGLVLP